MTLRSYHMLITADIVACEDTRKTGKMLQLMKDKRLKQKFKDQFGASMDDFMDDDHNLPSSDSSTQQATPEVKATSFDAIKDTQFYLSDEEFNDARMLSRLEQANADLDQAFFTGGEDIVKSQVQQILEKLEVEMTQNKFGDLEAQIRKDRENALELSMTKEDKEFVEMVDQEYYKRVKTSDEFYRRKKLILANLDKLQQKVEKQAKNFDDYSKLKFIVLQKAG